MSDRIPAGVPDARNEARRRMVFILCVASLVAGAGLRVGPMFTDFWLDEVWNWEVARHLSSPLAILSAEASDNNHPINTFFVWLLGAHRPWPAYRLLSLATGIGSIVLCGLAGARYGPWGPPVAMLFAGLSPILVFYSSEARGYSPAAFFALAAFLAASRPINGRSWAMRGILWGTVALGFLSHLSFAFVYLGILCRDAYRIVRRRGVFRAGVVDLLASHAIPIAALVGAGIRFSTLTIRGGPDYVLHRVLLATASYALGIPDHPMFLVVAVPAIAALFGYECVRSARAGSDEWVFFVVAVMLAPATALLVLRPSVLSPRYFLVLAPFVLLSLAGCVAARFGRKRGGGVLAWVFLLAFCAGSLAMTTRLAREGRGQYLKALRYMAAETAGDSIVVGTDKDIRVPLLLAFYEPYLGGRKRIRFQRSAPDSASAPEWFIHSVAMDEPGIDRHYRPAPDIAVAGWCCWQLVKEYPHFGLSGMSWYLYRRVAGSR